MIDYFKQINGISTPIFGVSWDLKKSDKAHLEGYLIEISNIRSIHPRHQIIDVESLIESIKTLRSINVKILKDIGFESKLFEHLEYVNLITMNFNNYLDSYKADGAPKLNEEFVSVYNDYRDRFLNAVEDMSLKYSLQIPKIFLEQ